MKLENILATALTATSAVLDNLGVAFEYKKLADKRRDGARKACKRLRAKVTRAEDEASKMQGAKADAEAARQQRDDYLLILNTIAKGDEARELIKIRHLLGEFSRGVSVLDGVQRLMELHVAAHKDKQKDCSSTGDQYQNGTNEESEQQG
jgi:hypothetical protein